VRLTVGGTQLISPAWNQARVWLTGSWVMQRPQDFIKEAGGCAEVPALADLSRVPPEAADSLLVDDLLTVFMGQVRFCAGGAQQSLTCTTGLSIQHTMQRRPDIRVCPWSSANHATNHPAVLRQAGQYVKAVPVEDDGSIWQRIGLYVQGVPDCSLQEQVRWLPAADVLA
jgi:hypothetical protein